MRCRRWPSTGILWARWCRGWSWTNWSSLLCSSSIWVSENCIQRQWIQFPRWAHKGVHKHLCPLISCHTSKGRTIQPMWGKAWRCRTYWRTKGSWLLFLSCPRHFWRSQAFSRGASFGFEPACLSLDLTKWTCRALAVWNTNQARLHIHQECTPWEKSRTLINPWKQEQHLPQLHYFQ